MTRSKPPPPPTEPVLKRAAARYIQRYGGPRAAVERALERLLHRAHPHHDFDPSQARHHIRSILDRLESTGLLDDRAWARSRAIRLASRGTSVPGIHQHLTARGISPDLVRELLRELRDRLPELDRVLAARHARRRRLGPFRPESARARHRQRDLAALGRSGFSFETARQVIDAESAHELHAWGEQLESARPGAAPSSVQSADTR